jgi:hydrogenase maturation protease
MPCRKVIGVGNGWRGDDAAGLVAARRLRELVPEGVEVSEAEGDLSSLLDLWASADEVLVIDAVRSGAAPGALQRVDARATSLPARFARRSTHAVGLAEAVELGRALGRLPSRLIVFGIEGERFEPGERLSSRVESGVSRAVDAVREELSTTLDGRLSD